MGQGTEGRKYRALKGHSDAYTVKTNISSNSSNRVATGTISYRSKPA
jgi:hypothetical protein